MYNSTCSNEKQVEAVETIFEYDEQGRICRRVVTTTTRGEAPIHTVSSYANGINDGALLEDTIELSEQSGVEKNLACSCWGRIVCLNHIFSVCDI